MLEHGIETGIIKRLPSGEYIEVHQPLGPVDDHGHGQLQYAGTSVPKRMNQIGASGRAVRGFLYPVKEKPEIIEAIEAAYQDSYASVGQTTSNETPKQKRELPE